ncbi:MAG: hypothetical protein Q9201_001896 [Fulgogasparrea decipioides]
MSCLPDLPKPGEYDALVVIVTILRQDTRKNLENLLENERSGQKFAFIYCYDNRFQRQLEELGRQGSIGQIYNIATNAYALGWKRLIIVDALSREQLTGDVRPGRSTDVSVVYVQLDNTKGDGKNSMPCEEVNVIAKRMNIDSARQTIREQKPVSNGIPRENGSLEGTLQEWFEAGMLLYDPLKPIYDKTLSSSPITYEVDRAIDQVLSLRTPLPYEVAAMIKQYAREEVDLEKLTSAPAKFETDPTRLEVHLLKPLKAAEVQSLQEMYNRKLQDCPMDVRCVVYPWIASQPATRRDLWRLFEFRNKDRFGPGAILIFAGWPGCQDLSVVGLLRFHRLLPMPTRRTTIEAAAAVWETVYSSTYPHNDYSRDYSDPAFELLLDPCSKYFYDPPPFVSLVKDAITAPVFFLIRHLTSEETSAIKAELLKPNGEDEEFELKDLAFIEWKADVDGTEQDIWRLLWQCLCYRGDGCTGTAIFIDRQTVSDNKVIVAEIMSDEYANQVTAPVVDEVYGSNTGVLYGRCEPKEAAGVRIRLHMATMEFDDFVGMEIDHCHKYYRPDLK